MRPGRDLREVRFLSRTWPVLNAIFVLVYAHVGATALDRQMLAWLKRIGMPYYIIVNKIDRITQVKLIEQRQSLALDLEVMAEHN